MQNRYYAPGEKPHRSFVDKSNQYFYVRTGVIEEVDIDKYTMTVRWEPGNGSRDRVPISFPYAGPAGFIGMLPEKGTFAIFAWYNSGVGGGSPLCVGFLPAGLDAGLNYNVVKIHPDQIPTSDVNEIQYKFRKLGTGDLIIASPKGGEIILNDNLELRDGSQDTFLLRDEDQSIIATSLNNFIFADGVSVSAGPAMRNALVLYDQNGKKIQNNGSLLSLPDGKENIYIVPFGKDITYDTQYYSEYRIDVDELSDGRLDLNDINSSSPLSTRESIITMAMGNYIGADKVNNPQQYGQILKAVLFASGNDLRGNFGLDVAQNNNTMDEPAILGLAYALHSLQSGSFIGVDKEGHYYMNLPASKSNPLGAGRSMSTLAQGNLKEIWGAEALLNNSWDLAAKGGIRWDVGAHNTNLDGRSIYIKTARGIRIEVNGDDDSGFALNEKYRGKTFENVSGTKTSVCANLTLVVNGLKTENIGGSHTQSIQSDKTLNVLGVYSETVSKEKQSKFGSRKTTITPKGNDELEVNLGDIITTITKFGQKKLSVDQGKIKKTIGTGVHETVINIGKYTIDAGAGKMEIVAPAGTVTLEGTTITIKGTASVSVDSPIVKLGSNAPIGGVVTGLPGIPSHNDYVTGISLKGSLKVSATA